LAIPAFRGSPGRHATFVPVQTDAQLLEAWRQGDEAAGNALFERYFEPLFRFFRGKVDDGAEDLVQQTFLALVRSASGVREASSFRAYVFTAARSKLYRHLSQHAAKIGPLDFGVDSIAALAPSPSSWAAEQEEQQVLHDALRRLPVDMQITLELYYLEGFEGDEVARIMDVPIGTVRSRLRRGLERLRREAESLTRSPAVLERSISQLCKDRPPIEGPEEPNGSQ
jgi:RNA polymerase sigma factor (sigma-70 family)